MKASYFPGCTLKNKAKDLDVYAQLSAEKLGVELMEIPEWQCCGGTFTARDEIATKLPALRALISAEKAGTPLVTVCSACHNVIKQTNNLFLTDKEFADRANRYLSGDKIPSRYEGKAVVMHYTELLKEIGFDKIKRAVVKPLNRKVACYYGCMLLRPSAVMAFDDPENPKIMENLVEALGGESVAFSQRNECCGSYLILEDKEATKKRSGKITESAKNAGADVIVTACPLCRYNLIKSGADIPVSYFTELLAEALGVTEEKR